MLRSAIHVSCAGAERHDIPLIDSNQGTGDGGVMVWYSPTGVGSCCRRRNAVDLGIIPSRLNKVEKSGFFLFLVVIGSILGNSVSEIDLIVIVKGEGNNGFICLNPGRSRCNGLIVGIGAVAGIPMAPGKKP